MNTEMGFEKTIEAQNQVGMLRDNIFDFREKDDYYGTCVLSHWTLDCTMRKMHIYYAK